MSWTPERIAELKRLWVDYSASQIAGKLGNVTRNAVIGKANRLGLSKPPSARSQKPRRPKNINPRSSTRTQNIGMRGGARFSGNAALKIDYDLDYDIDPANDVVVPISMKLSLQELNDTTCKWPDGDPSRLDTLSFCGHKPHEEKPYCEYHSNKAYLPSQRRR